MLCEGQSGSALASLANVFSNAPAARGPCYGHTACLGASSMPCPLRLSLASSTLRSHGNVCAQLSGQFPIPFVPVTNAIGLDPRVTSWVPNLPDGGLFGGPGNGGNLGRK